MRRASLRKAQFNGANLAAYLGFYKHFELFCCSREVFVPENVGHAALCAFSDVSAVRVAYSFGNGNGHVRFLFKFGSDRREKRLVVEIHFGQIYQIGSQRAVQPRQTRRRRQPARVASHDLNDRDRPDLVNGTVSGDLLHGRCDEFRRRSEAGRMVCLREVVVDRFRNAHYVHLSAAFFRIGGKFCRGVHRIVSSDVEEISYVVFFKKREYLGIDRVVHVRGKFFSARTERRRGRAFKRKYLLVRRKDLSQIDEVLS